jgi:uncharacterized membrane protein
VGTHLLLAVLALLTTGLTAGVLFGVALANVPGFLAMSAPQYVAAHQLFDRHYEPWMPLLVAVGVVSDVTLAVAADGVARTALYALAAALLAGVALVSRFANVPLLASVRGADADALPADWVDIRPAWSRWHLARTALSVAALLTVAATVAG